jgi:hypothetical protein
MAIFAIAIVGLFASALLGCQGDGIDNDDVRTNTRTTTRVDSDGDRTTRRRR